MLDHVRQDHVRTIFLFVYLKRSVYALKTTIASRACNLCPTRIEIAGRTSSVVTAGAAAAGCAPLIVFLNSLLKKKDAKKERKKGVRKENGYWKFRRRIAKKFVSFSFFPFSFIFFTQTQRPKVTLLVREPPFRYDKHTTHLTSSL